MPTYIVKDQPDVDWYVMWSTIVDAPTAFGTRAELCDLARDPADVASERFARADANGSSAAWPDWPQDRQPFSWTDESFIVANVRIDGADWAHHGYSVPRTNLREFVERVAADRTDLADLLEIDPYADQPVTRAT